MLRYLWMLSSLFLQCIALIFLSLNFRTNLMHILGASGGDFTKVQKTEENEDLDVTGETENYGPPQYSEDMVRSQDNRVEVNENNLLHCTPGPSFEYNINENPPKKFTEFNELLLKIEKLENELLNANRAQACRVCLDKISRHVVSTICWHVHCESCWLQVMASKKVCPQCKAIVTPADLRKIYL